MATITIDDVADIVNTTQDELGEMKITELAHDLQDYVAMNKLLNKEVVKYQSGSNINFNVLTDPDDNTRDIGLFDVDNVNQVDGTTTGTVPWRTTTTGYTYDKLQVLTNRSPRMLLDFVKTKRYQMLIQWAEKMEEKFWGSPSSSTDETTPYGLRYWLTYNATEGFNGGNNSNFSSGPAGINATTYTRWKNYTAQYATVNKTDAVRKLRRALRYCNFKPVVTPEPIKSNNRGNRYGVYTTYDVIYQFEEILEAQNDNLGNDLASKDGLTYFRKIPVTDVPYLTDNATGDPIVGINWGTFYPVGLEGDFMVQTPAAPVAGQHRVVKGHLDCTYNYVCCDRRRNFLISDQDWGA